MAAMDDFSTFSCVSCSYMYCFKVIKKMHHETFNNTEQLSIAFPYTVFFLLLFSNKMMVFRAGIHKMLVRIANGRPDHTTQSDWGLHCLPGP